MVFGNIILFEIFLIKYTFEETFYLSLLRFCVYYFHPHWEGVMLCHPN